MKHPDMKAPRPRKSGKPASNSETPATAKGMPADVSVFDLWLNRSLHKLYDDVAREPVPDALRKLIEDDLSNSEP